MQPLGFWLQTPPRAWPRLGSLEPGSLLSCVQWEMDLLISHGQLVMYLYYCMLVLLSLVTVSQYRTVASRRTWNLQWAPTLCSDSTSGTTLYLFLPGATFSTTHISSHHNTMLSSSLSTSWLRGSTWCVVIPCAVCVIFVDNESVRQRQIMSSITLLSQTSTVLLFMCIIS